MAQDSTTAQNLQTSHKKIPEKHSALCYTHTKIMASCTTTGVYSEISVQTEVFFYKSRQLRTSCNLALYKQHFQKAKTGIMPNLAFSFNCVDYIT